MSVIRKGLRCDYCGDRTEVRGTPILADAAIGALICKSCWNVTREGGVVGEGIDIGEFGDGAPEPSPTFTLEQVKAAFYQTMGGGYQSDTVDLWWLAMEQNLRTSQQGGGKG